MTDIQEDPRYLDYTKDFFARITMIDKRYPSLEYALSLSWDRTKLAPQYDWLLASSYLVPGPTFKFAYHSQTENRLHFNISDTGQNANKKLGVSRNGYLGLYEVSEVSDYWKLEPLRWTDRGLVCQWRDHRGHEVKQLGGTGLRFFGEPVFYLNVDGGEVHHFLIEMMPAGGWPDTEE
ncbi:hypothetical protein [Pseudomonas sp. H9]|uniref:hypothetical protein n=1 Tax=Pseudomonas sp. H9 TaxID=483968 RepID=UPI0010577C12|nr:hypothetical protein [Pseudomonas sp. H9]TDF85826.1 hypothetical protein E1573_02580 [Pseudomonas sp. H9]